MRHLPPVASLVGAALVAAAAGCGGASRAGLDDKAGSATAPLVLTVATDTNADGADAETLRYFVRRVEHDSDGRLRVRVVYGAGGDSTPFSEARIGRLVRDGTFDLGWIYSRNWDLLGVQGLRALQAPFLITTYSHLNRVLTSALAPELLRELRHAGVAGLALVPGELRHPLGLERPLRRAADFAGARIHVAPSRTTDALVHALGATPVHLSQLAAFPAYSAGKVDGKEFGYVDSFGGVVTANLTLFPTTHTLFANEKALARLDDGRRAALRAAAAETVKHAIRTQSSERTLLQRFCREGGRGATASAADRTAIARSAQPVLAWLERDPQTRRFIAGIRRLGGSLPPARPPAVPPACAVGAH